MAVTRLQRKELLNKTRARVRVENLKILKSRIYVKSPYALESGIILEDSDMMANGLEMETTPVIEPTGDITPTKKAKKVKAEIIVQAPDEDVEVAEVISDSVNSESETSIPDEIPITNPDAPEIN